MLTALLYGHLLTHICDKIAAINEKFSQCARLLDSLPGLELSRQQQEELCDSLQKELALKTYGAAMPTLPCTQLCLL